MAGDRGAKGRGAGRPRGVQAGGGAGHGRQSDEGIRTRCMAVGTHRHMGQIARGACYAQPPKSDKNDLAVASWVRIANANRVLGFT